MSARAAAPHTLPGSLGVAGGLGAAPSQGNSQEGETLIRMEPFSLTHVQPQHG